MNKSFLIDAFRQSYRNQRVTAQVYRAFAEREHREPHQSILLVLVENAERSATVYASRLLRMGVLPPLSVERIGDRWWQWLLVRGGVRWITAWVEWTEKRDLHRYIRLFEARPRTQPSTSRKSHKTETFRQFLLKPYN